MALNVGQVILVLKNKHIFFIGQTIQLEFKLPCSLVDETYVSNIITQKLLLGNESTFIFVICTFTVSFHRFTICGVKQRRWEYWMWVEGVLNSAVLKMFTSFLNTFDLLFGRVSMLSYPPFSAKEELVDTLNSELHQKLRASLENGSFIQRSHQPH